MQRKSGCGISSIYYWNKIISCMQSVVDTTEVKYIEQLFSFPELDVMAFQK
jgi:hypothetical protein